MKAIDDFVELTKPIERERGCVITDPEHAGEKGSAWGVTVRKLYTRRPDFFALLRYERYERWAAAEDV